MAGSRSGATRLIAFLATLGAFFSFLRPLTGLLRKLRLAKGFLKLAQVSSFIAGAQQLCLYEDRPRLGGPEPSWETLLPSSSSWS